LPSGQFDTNTIDLSFGGPGTLILWFTETGVTSPTGTVNVTSGLTSNEITGGITSVTLSTFLDPANGISPPNGTPLDSASFTGIGTQTSTKSIATGPGPYSLEEVYTIVATGPGVANLTIDLNATPSAVPEPASLAFVGTGFVGLVLLRRRRKAA
jgi:PEP-CTERM motif